MARYDAKIDGVSWFAEGAFGYVAPSARRIRAARLRKLDIVLAAVEQDVTQRQSRLRAEVLNYRSGRAAERRGLVAEGILETVAAIIKEAKHDVDRLRLINEPSQIAYRMQYGGMRSEDAFHGGIINRVKFHTRLAQKLIRQVDRLLIEALAFEAKGCGEGKR